MLKSLVVGVVVALLTLTSFAHAASDKVAVYVDGQDDARVRAKINDVVAKLASAADDRAFAKALGSVGKGQTLLDGKMPKPISAALRERLQTAGRRAGAVNVVAASGLAATGNQRAVRMVVVQVDSGKVVADDTIVVARASKRKKKLVWSDDLRGIESALNRSLAGSGSTSVAATPAPAAESAPAATGAAASSLDMPLWAGGDSKPTDASSDTAATSSDAKRKSTTVSSTSDRRGRPEVVLVWAGYDHQARRFAHTAPAALGLREYSPGVGAPGLDLGLRIYPMVLAGERGILADLGVEVSYQRMLAAKSELRNSDTTFDTTASSLGLAARLRHSVGEHELGVFLGYGQRAFVLSSSSALTGLLPSASYSFARLGGDASVRVSTARVLASVAFLWPFGRGEILDQAMPDASGWGIAGGVGARVPLIAGIDAMGMLRFTQLATNGGDNGKATDQFFDLLVGVAYSM